MKILNNNCFKNPYSKSFLALLQTSFKIQNQNEHFTALIIMKNRYFFQITNGNKNMKKLSSFKFFT